YKQQQSPNLKHGGVYVLLKPVYVPVDLDIIKRILIKDFSYFQGHANDFHPKDNLSMNLFFIHGDIWRKLKKTKGLEELVRSHVKHSQPLDIKEVAARFTTDIIVSCGFGLESNSLGEAETEFRMYGRKVFELKAWRMFILNGIPRKLLTLCYHLGFTAFPRDVNRFFSKTVKDNICYREQTKLYRKDFMQLLLEMKNNGNEASNSITDDEIIAQCFVFFAAGFETSSTTTTYAMLELSQNQDIQEKLRAEIKDVLEKHEGVITYEAIMEMTYLEMVVNETLRKYPPVPFIPRYCTKDYHVPGTDVIIKEGTQVQIPAWGIQTDPEYFPNPEKFNPENFSAENKSKIPEMAFIPFGEGPRMCIGLRFGKIQSKLALVSLLKNFRFTLNEKTHTPIEFTKVSFVLSVEGDVWLNVTEI
ncbi:probable cytochrome P450 6a14, partial [Sitophilus oryzae]|uniref:Probable cytochrome P450 6a14 n=1 Tax=Sitophilus oryzae TaxID=7048 RepID=A0A6J2YSE6_SITOR